MSKWVLVTGAARRLGRTIALELAAAGWDIVVHYHTSCTEAENLAKEIQGIGRAACLAEIDLLNTKLVENLIPSLTREIGSISALVNNASLFEPDHLRPDAGRHNVINVEAPRILSESFRGALPPGQAGVIVNLLDADPSKPEFDAYNASKKTLEAMTIQTARNFAPHIRVNGVAPGPVVRGPRESAEHFLKRSTASRLLDVPTTPEAVASAVRFLVENSCVTGEIIHVDGGSHLKRSKS